MAALPIASPSGGLSKDFGHRSDARAPNAAERLGGRWLLAEIAHCREVGGYVENPVGPNRDDGGPFDVRAPNSSGQGAGEPVVGQRRPLRQRELSHVFSRAKPTALTAPQRLSSL